MRLSTGCLTSLEEPGLLVLLKVLTSSESAFHFPWSWSNVWNTLWLVVRFSWSACVVWSLLTERSALPSTTLLVSWVSTMSNTQMVYTDVPIPYPSRLFGCAHYDAVWAHSEMGAAHRCSCTHERMGGRDDAKGHSNMGLSDCKGTEFWVMTTRDRRDCALQSSTISIV